MSKPDVITYAYAHPVPAEGHTSVSLCARHCHTHAYALGRIEHGVHRGTCRDCTTQAHSAQK